jgi:hypothetical protein
MIEERNQLVGIAALGDQDGDVRLTNYPQIAMSTIGWM